MKIKHDFIFLIMLIYIKNDYSVGPENWYVHDILSSIAMPDSFFDSDSPTSDPAYWFEWKELFEEEIAKNKKIIDENDGLTLEQGLLAVQYFLEQRYWMKNADILLKDAYDDLMKEVKFYGDRLSESALWREWMVAVEEAKKSNKVFDGSQ